MRSLFGGLFGQKSAADGPLTPDGRLASDLWLDQPDAARRIEARRRRGELGDDEAAGLSRFAEQGYLTFALDEPEVTYAAIDADVARLWREKPSDLPFAYKSQLKPLAFADEAADRQPSYRLAYLHSHSPAALRLFLHPQIFRWVEAIFGEPAVATQSLYFEFGSQQPLHRDPVHVVMTPPSHLVAAWIALEDVGARCGPLRYVPGSHRLPYHQLSPGEYRFDHARHGDAEAVAMAEHDARQCAARGLEPREFTCRRGDVLLWHASLLHGGAIPEDPALTRKSLVVHFSTRAHYPRLRETVLQKVPGPDGTRVWRPRIVETERLVERDGCRGFANPLRG